MIEPGTVLKAVGGRPWPINQDVWERCMSLFPGWLQDRQGIVVYQNQMMDSSRFGDRTYLPARYLDVGNQWQDAPAEYFPDGLGLPSLRQRKVDVIALKEFDGNLELALACFAKGPK